MDLLVFDSPRNSEPLCQQAMKLHKGVWSHQVSHVFLAWQNITTLNAHRSADTHACIAVLFGCAIPRIYTVTWLSGAHASL